MEQTSIQNSQPFQQLLQACAIRTQSAQPQATFGKRGREAMENSHNSSYSQMGQADYNSIKLFEDYIRLMTTTYQAMLGMPAQQYLMQSQSGQVTPSQLGAFQLANSIDCKNQETYIRKNSISGQNGNVFPPSISPMNKSTMRSPSNLEKFDLDGKDSVGRRRRCNEWTSEEIVLLLHCTKLMINCELKTISQALFACIKRSPGKCWGRAAEKKLKRMKIFVNWKTCNKKKVLKKIDEKLEEFGELGRRIDPHVIEITRQLKQAEYSGMIRAK